MKATLRKTATSANPAQLKNIKGKAENMTAAPSGAVGGPSRNYFTLSTTYYYVSLALIAAISLWIRKGFPVYLAPNAVHDDGLFLNMARYLKAGAWLGPYGKYTLIKGMIYPLFVCVVSFAPIPLKVAEQAVYLAASALTAGLVRRRAGNNHLALILFTVLAFPSSLESFSRSSHAGGV